MAKFRNMLFVMLLAFLFCGVQGITKAQDPQPGDIQISKAQDIQNVEVSSTLETKAVLQKDVVSVSKADLSITVAITETENLRCGSIAGNRYSYPGGKSIWRSTKFICKQKLWRISESYLS